MLCKWGGECDGCGCCQPEQVYYCPQCGRKLYYDETIYTAGSEVIGCEHCVKSESVYRRLEK